MHMDPVAYRAYRLRVEHRRASISGSSSSSSRIKQQARPFAVIIGVSILGDLLILHNRIPINEYFVLAAKTLAKLI